MKSPLSAVPRVFVATVLVGTLVSWALRVAYQQGAASRQGGWQASLARSNAIHERTAKQHEDMLDSYKPTGDANTDQTNMWDMFGPTFPCIERERFGETTDGGKWVCSAHDVLGPEPCWVFSLGSNGQCGFEADVRRRYPHCRIDVYDPTISESTAGKVAAKTEATVHRKWIVDEATRQLHQPAQPSQKLLTPADPSEPPQEYTTIAREMAEIGAPRLNILKVDIEGVEWTVLEDYFANDTAMPFAEILIELHTLELPERWGATLMERLRHFFSGLARQGYRVANNELNQRCNRRKSRNCLHFIEYTFVKTDSSGNVMLS